MTDLCQCGCGEFTKEGRWRPGHNRRATTEFRYESTKNRWYVVGRDGKRYAWYRIVMWNELGRELRADEAVHHVNGDSADDRPENLCALTPGEHSSLHIQQDPERYGAYARRAGAVASRNRDTRVDVLCARCGVVFRAPRWRRAQYRELFCTWDCANSARREGLTGIKRVQREGQAA